MDIVSFWEKQIKEWDKESKCGLCWAEFEAPLTRSAMNIVQQEEDSKCCVHSYLTNLRYSENRIYNTSNPFIRDANINGSFELYFVVNDVLGRNNYMEIKGHSVKDSRWEAILKPLYDCLTSEDLLQECENMGYLFKINRWDLNLVIVDGDNNNTGWRLNAEFSTKKKI